MNGEDLLKAAGNLNDEYIAEAEDALNSKKKKPYMKYLSVAASLVLVCAVTLGYFQNAGAKKSEPSLSESNMPYDYSIKKVEREDSLPLYGMEEIDYGVSFGSVASIAADDGTFILSSELTYLMDKYMDTARYRVKVYFYSNKEGLSNTDPAVQADLERLYNEGYITAVEKYEENGNTVTHITLHATYTQIQNFSAAENIGYYLTLFGGSENVVSYNGGIK